MDEDRPGVHGPMNWFGRGSWTYCTCGYAPQDNGLLNAHWADHGFKIVDDHGNLLRIPVVPDLSDLSKVERWLDA